MSTEAEDKAAFDVIRYAQCWEDSDALIEGLAIEPRSAFLSICSAGDNSLALLGAGAERVVAVDMSLPQVMLAKLKAAAFVILERDEMLRFLGYAPASAAERRAFLTRVGRYAGEDVVSYWRAQVAAIEAGIVSTGKFEKYFALFRKTVLPLIHRRATVEELVRPKRPAERLDFYRHTWDTWRWRSMFGVFFSRFVMGRLGRDPRFFDYVEGPVAERIRSRAEHAMTVLDPSANPYLQWIVLGHYATALPYILRPENYATIREKVAKGGFEVFHGSIEAYLDAHPLERFNGFNLSDIFEYMNEANYGALLARLLAASYPNARFVYWNMLAPRSRPEAFAGRLAPESELAARLHANDKAFFYSRLVVERAT